MGLPWLLHYRVNQGVDGGIKAVQFEEDWIGCGGSISDARIEASREQFEIPESMHCGSEEVCISNVWRFAVVFATCGGGYTSRLHSWRRSLSFASQFPG